MQDSNPSVSPSTATGSSRLLWPLLLFGAVALVGLGFVVGLLSANSEEQSAVPETLAMQSGECDGLDITVQRLLTSSSGQVSTSELVGQLKEQLPPDLQVDADNLIVVYQGLENGDLSALTNDDQLANAEQAAGAITRYLANECGLDVSVEASDDN